jgi:DNA ligase D-like protein (predicted 3'-phosphoesterase)
LAVPTDDHEIEYAAYEGVHTGSKYGSGAVIVWDAGTYWNLTKDSRGRVIQAADAMAGGHLKVELHGTKLTGAWAFTRTGRDGDWLLVKVRDAAADAALDLIVAEPHSVLSGLTIEEMAATTP